MTQALAIVLAGYATFAAILGALWLQRWFVHYRRIQRRLSKSDRHRVKPSLRHPGPLPAARAAAGDRAVSEESLSHLSHAA